MYMRKWTIRQFEWYRVDEYQRLRQKSLRRFFIYQKIVTPVWVAMLILTFVYFVFCVQKSLVFDEKILEDYTYEIRI